MPFFLIVGAILTALKIAGIATLSWWLIVAITFIPMLLLLVFLAGFSVISGLVLAGAHVVTRRFH